MKISFNKPILSPKIATISSAASDSKSRSLAINLFDIKDAVKL